MRIIIEHRLLYTYTAPVKLGPHRLHLLPRYGLRQRLISQQLEITPEPSTIFMATDAEGNPTQWAYFNEPTERLEVNMELSINSLFFNPFDFIIFPAFATQLPFTYPDDARALLAPYLATDDVTPEVRKWAAGIRQETGGRTVDFLMRMCAQLKNEFQYFAREKGHPFSAAETLARRGGSCRDLSCLMIAACQAEGLAARFVSGYAWVDDGFSHHELHAWVEVYLPGAGWRGFDPTAGGAATHHHLVMAASAFPHRTAPLRGNYTGNADSRLETEVKLSLLEDTLSSGSSSVEAPGLA